MVTTEQTLCDFEEAYELLRHHWGTGYYRNYVTGQICTRGAFMAVTKTGSFSPSLVSNFSLAKYSEGTRRRAAMETEFAKVTGTQLIETWNDTVVRLTAGKSKRRQRRYVLKTIHSIIVLLRARMVAETAKTVEKKRTARVIETRLLVTRDAHNYELVDNDKPVPLPPTP